MKSKSPPASLLEELRGFRPARKTWANTLPDEVLAELTAVRDEFFSGRLSASLTKHRVVLRMVAFCRDRKIPASESTITRWMDSWEKP